MIPVFSLMFNDMLPGDWKYDLSLANFALYKVFRTIVSLTLNNNSDTCCLWASVLSSWEISKCRFATAESTFFHPPKCPLVLSIGYVLMAKYTNPPWLSMELVGDRKVINAI